MLTGAIAPTDGYAVVVGKDIRTQMNEIRQDTGICLQHDCLFPYLTVKEHLQFFSRLKGLYSKVSKEEAEQEIDQHIRDVALFEKRDTYSRSLSGGMKRKLSVAIAFSGGSKVVLLDEPTSGMDPFSRRFTWNVIRQYRQDRCIILTTHFMDEADILGDRIAIMAEGTLRCAGSSLFLKKKYGVGYQLTIEKSLEHSNEQQYVDDTDERTSIDETLKQIVKSAVPESTLLNNTGSEVRYQLPIAASGNFPSMFAGLDSQYEKRAIQSYGVSMTTLVSTITCETYEKTISNPLPFFLTPFFSF
jgi:ATP-binding cassette, subfamily A (ABC1), member 3